MLRDVEIASASLAFTTLASARTYIGGAGHDGDAFLTAMIEAVSVQIEAYCGTVIKRRTVTERITLDVVSRSLILRHAPAASLTSLSYDGAALVVGDFRLAKDTAMLRRIDGSGFEVGADYVAVYEAGYDPIPPAIEQAANALLKAALENAQRAEGVQQEQVPDVGSITYAPPGSVLFEGMNGVRVPSAVANLLAPYVLRYST
jgi:hypothetical protein